MRLIVLLSAAFLMPADSSLVIGTEPLPATVQTVEARLHVLPGAPSMPVLNPDFAARAGFGGGLFGTRAAIGPVRIPGKSTVVRLDVGTGSFKRRVTWFEAPISDVADGVIGPGGIPVPRIRFDLRPASPGERSVALPMFDAGYSGLGVELPVGDDMLRILFQPERANSIATAAAGAAIAAASDGRFDRPGVDTLITLGVSRPTRHLALATPFVVGPVSLSELLVRTADGGSAAGIPVEGDEPDPDEIVVTGTGKKAKKGRMALSIGADALAGCSSILFDKPARQVVLTCR